ncbi:MAG: DUF504 domain-containing protein [Verrucomicrobia bacterium]|jgi:uncharacterized protein (UPF0248 family)|nr:DUF504 domain-containing protein [Verrucomicrobiota bacterium]
MQPIHELLARIRHDPEFGKGEFEIGYLDRFDGTTHRVAFREISFPADQRRVFEVLDDSGQARRIPFHRVREVYRDGRLIWRRPNKAAAPAGQTEDAPETLSGSAP